MTKEPEIKLFGRRIVFPENGGEFSGVSSVESGGSVDCGRQRGRVGEENWERAYEGEASVELSQTTAAQDVDENTGVGAVEESQNTNAVSELDNSPKSPSTEDDNDAASANHAETENEQSDAPDPQEKKTLEKPDKILPCPRCNSTDTKFCYYNNYNVNQPRYFCRSCQRYWTDGGTMRNVPVGAGRRKNKNLASHCRHIMISEDLPAAVPIDTPDGFRHLNQKQNGTVLSFGTAPPQYESMYTAGKGTTPSGASNGYSKIEQQDSIPSKGQENARDCSDGGKNMLQPPLMQNVNGFLSPVPCIPGFPWPVPWNSAVPIPTGYILPYYPAPYWSCPLPNAWNVPLLPVPSANGNGNEPNVSHPSSQLGKHSRNGQLLKANEESVEPKTASNPLVVPKTLRINDPEEAAKSSIWTTLGIKHGSLSKGGLFTGLQSKADERKAPATASSPVLQANPAALSRSIRFRESA